MNRRFFYSVIVVVITIFFAACISSSCHLDGNIAVVKMEIRSFKQSSEGKYYGGVVNELALVKYENGILELNFPEVVPDEYLGVYFWANSTNTIPDGVTISDPQVKVGHAEISTYNGVGIQNGNFILRDSSWWSAEYIYADRDFTVKGTSESGLVFDCSFEKGWNVSYYVPLDKGKYTTQRLSDENFEWRHEEFICD